MSISIDNPLIFLYPKPVTPTSEQSNLLLHHDHSTTQYNNHHNHHINHSPSHIPPSHPGLSRPESSNAVQQQLNLFPSHPSINSNNPTSIIPTSTDQLDSRSTILSGSLILKFSKPKEIKKIIISLRGQSYIGFNDRPYEYQTILSKEIELDLANQLFNSRDQHPDPGNVHYNSHYKTFILDKGNYRFHWSFILPPDLPPYERGQFGRTTHKVVAKVKLGSGLGLSLKSVGKNLASILLGVGGGGQEIEAESYFVAITNPLGNSEDISHDLGLNLDVTELSEQLGSYTLSASSCYFTVAGLLSFKFKLNDIPQRKKIIKIYKISCLIKQQYRLISIKDKDSKTGCPAESWPPCQRRKVFILDHSNVPNLKRVLPNGQSLDSSDHPDHFPEFEPSDPNLEYPPHQDSAHHSEGDIGSQRTSPCHSRHRSRRGLFSTPTSSCENDNSESTSRSRPPTHSRNGFASIKLGRRREPSRSKSQTPARESRLYPSRSVDRLHSTVSANSVSPVQEDDDVNRPAGESCRTGFQRPRLLSQTSLENALLNNRRLEMSTASCDGQRSSGAAQSSQRLPVVEQGTASTPSHLLRGRQSESSRDPGHSPRDKSRNSRSRGRKSRPENGWNAHNTPSDEEIPLVTLTDDHKSWEIEHIGRLPTDDVIRPSTNPGTHTNIHIFHTLLFEIHYGVEDDKSAQTNESELTTKTSHECASPPIVRKVLSITKPVQISSCCCMVESMVLPPYSKHDPNAEFVQHPTPSHAARMFKCVCGMSTDVLLKTQNPKNSQSNPSTDGRVESDDHEQISGRPPVTNSTLTFRTKSTSVASHQSSLQQEFVDPPELHTPPSNLNNFDNCFISIK